MSPGFDSRSVQINHFLNLSVVIGVALAMFAVYIPELNIYLKMVPLSASHFGMLILFVFTKLFVIEAIKLRIYKKTQDAQLAA